MTQAVEKRRPVYLLDTGKEYLLKQRQIALVCDHCRKPIDPSLPIIGEFVRRKQSRGITVNYHLYCYEGMYI